MSAAAAAMKNKGDGGEQRHMSGVSSVVSNVSARRRDVILKCLGVARGMVAQQRRSLLYMAAPTTAA
jgi:hypothetical protein